MSQAAPSRQDLVREALRRTCELLDGAEIWYCLVYGTLLGAIRAHTVIDWDTDFDIFIRPSDVPAVLALSDEHLAFVRCSKQGAELAVGSGWVPWFDPARLAAIFLGQKIGDVYYPTLFNDGVLRIYDPDEEVLWTPHSSVPHFFFIGERDVEMDGVHYRAPAEPEAFLEGVYGADWRVPYRAVEQGGTGREGTTSHGDTYLPKLAGQLEWCEARGWDRTQYLGEPTWPRRVRGAGPRGATSRAAATSGSLWWRDLGEVAAHF